MQTFLKMSSVVYSMAGLGSVEESKVYKDNFDEKEDPDSLKEEMRDEFNPKDQQQEVRTRICNLFVTSNKNETTNSPI